MDLGADPLPRHSFCSVRYSPFRCEWFPFFLHYPLPASHHSQTLLSLPNPTSHGDFLGEEGANEGGARGRSPGRHGEEQAAPDGIRRRRGFSCMGGVR